MPLTKCILLSQDVQWLQKIYKHWDTTSVPHVVRVIGEDIQVETVEDNGPATPTTPNNTTTTMMMTMMKLPTQTTAMRLHHQRHPQGRKLDLLYPASNVN